MQSSLQLILILHRRGGKEQCKVVKNSECNFQIIPFSFKIATQIENKQLKDSITSPIHEKMSYFRAKGNKKGSPCRKQKFKNLLFKTSIFLHSTPASPPIRPIQNYTKIKRR